MGFFSEEFLSWLDQHADEIDKQSCQAGEQLIESCLLYTSPSPRDRG
mgnify:CR=1 FL=1